MQRLVFGFLLTLMVGACEEAPLVPPGLGPHLNAPMSLVLVPGTSLGVVANANVNLVSQEGSLVAVDLDTREVLDDTLFPIRSFAGRLLIDTPAQRIYVPDRGDDALLVVDYAIPGTGGEEISFSTVDVVDPAENVTYGIRTDELPFDVVAADNTVRGDVLLVTNTTTGTMSVMKKSSLKPIDLYPDHDRWTGVELFSLANFQSRGDSPSPGYGAQRMVYGPDLRLLFVASALTNLLYVFDSHDQAVEAMTDLSSLAPSGGMRGIAVDASQRVYVAHLGLSGVVVLDASEAVENGIDYEVLEPKLIDILQTNPQPDGVTLSSDESRLFVSSLGRNTVQVFDTAKRTLLTTIEISGGASPGEIINDAGRGVMYVLNFLSDNITVLDETTGAIVDTIE